MFSQTSLGAVNVKGSLSYVVELERLYSTPPTEIAGSRWSTLLGLVATLILQYHLGNLRTAVSQKTPGVERASRTLQAVNKT